ncbi:MAG: lytic transglycosylase F, partial [Thermoanaerobaculia bacterium]
MKSAMLAATAVLGVFLPSLPAPAQAPAGGSPPIASAAEVRQGLATKPWTGDFDGMIKRRRIRVLVPYSKTHYFVDGGTQRGLMVDAFRLFEDDLNKELKRGN